MIIPLAMRDLVVTAPSFSPLVMEGIEDRGHRTTASPTCAKGVRGWSTQILPGSAWRRLKGCPRTRTGLPKSKWQGGPSSRALPALSTWLTRVILVASKVWTGCAKRFADVFEDQIRITVSTTFNQEGIVDAKGNGSWRWDGLNIVRAPIQTSRPPSWKRRVKSIGPACKMLCHTMTPWVGFWTTEETQMQKDCNRRSCLNHLACWIEIPWNCCWTSQLLPFLSGVRHPFLWMGARMAPRPSTWQFQLGKLVAAWALRSCQSWW